jgi:hypothetical protein
MLFRSSLFGEPEGVLLFSTLVCSALTDRDWPAQATSKTKRSGTTSAPLNRK